MQFQRMNLVVRSRSIDGIHQVCPAWEVWSEAGAGKGEGDGSGLGYGPGSYGSPGANTAGSGIWFQSRVWWSS